jgi:aspartyl aminopeptidase
MLHDALPPTRAGLNDEFVLAPRLDNLGMSHAALLALTRAAGQQDADAGLVPLVALFDHEEVGSSSAYGAQAPILPTILERIVLACGGDRERYHQAIAGSLCVSADMAHAVHPNYPDRHEANHRPILNGGPVIKTNAQQRYATCARTAALFQELCRRADVPVQHYAHRTDLPCGSTIGPITATLLGIPTVDVGNSMLSMHSAREMAGSEDPELMTRVMARFFTWPDPV